MADESPERAATHRQAYELTGNPIHAERAITCFGLGEPLPRWLREYQLMRANNVLDLEHAVLDGEISPKKALEVLPRALGFVRQGKNMFHEYRQLHEDSLVSARYLVEQLGNQKPPKAIVEDLGGFSRRTVKRKIDKVRRILSWPKPTS
jgi:hypothetical protein